MPKLSDSLVKSVNLEGYASSAPQAPGSTLQPVVSPIDGRPVGGPTRCPIPTFWQSTPDSLRQFYAGGAVPQSRIMTPQSNVIASGEGPNKYAEHTPMTDGITSVRGSVVNIPPVGPQPITTVRAPSAQTSGGVPHAPSSTQLNQSTVTSIATPVLPPGSKYVGTVSMAKCFQLLSVAASNPVRVQLYGTSQAQTQDLSRAIDAPPAAGTAQNLISDVVLDTVPYEWSFQNRMGANGDTSQVPNVSLTLTNLSNTSAAITVTFQYVPLES